MNNAAVFELMRGGVVVSVQASDGSPLRSTPVISAMTAAVLRGQPAGLRINGPEDIRAVRSLTQLPIIGLHKVHNGIRNIITPNLSLAVGLAEAGADIIAVDATREVLGSDFSFLERVANETGRPVMADISTLEEARRAWDLGVGVVSTTLSGYTPESVSPDGGPDLELVTKIAEQGMTVIGEGRYRTLAQVASGFERGALAIVVGGAISDPGSITASFVTVSPLFQSRVQ